jgi:hypothetical protein
MRFNRTAWMPGTRPGMTISFDFVGFVMAGLVPAIHVPVGIPLIACHGVFFRILLGLILMTVRIAIYKQPWV